MMHSAYDNSVTQGSLPAIFENFPHLLYLYNIQLEEYIYVNSFIESLLGYPWIEVKKSVNQAFIHLFHPNDADIIKERRNKMNSLKDKEFIEAPLRLRHQNGEYKETVAREVMYAKDTFGTPLLLLGIAIDVTESKQIESVLRANEAGFNHIIEKAMLGICVTDDKGYYEQANSIYCNMYGYAPDEILGKHFTIMAPKADRHAVWQEIYDSFIKGEEEIAGDWIVKTKDSRLKITNTDAIRYRDKNGQHKVFTFVLDVTDLRIEEKTSEASQLLNKAITEQTNIGICFFDTQAYKFTDANRYYLQMLDYTFEELTQLTFPEVTALKPEVLQLQLNQLGQTRTPLILEAKQKKKEGQLIEVRAEISLVHTASQPILYAVVKELEDLNKKV